MTLYSMKDMLLDAYRHHYAIPAFNFENFEALIGIFAAAEANDAPLIVQIVPAALRYLGVEHVVSFVTIEARRRRIPTALHLDHGDDWEVILAAIEHGFTSVMVDGSGLPFHDNVALTRKVIQIARPRGVTVEAMIGHIAEVSEQPLERPVTDVHHLTSVEEAYDFYQSTGVDVLAVSIGSIHGVEKQIVRLDLRRLNEINQRLSIPLVLHGSSGVSYEDLQVVPRFGITKTNVDTILLKAFRHTLETKLTTCVPETRIREIMRDVRKSIQEQASRRQRLLQCDNKACHFHPDL